MKILTKKTFSTLQPLVVPLLAFLLAQSFLYLGLPYEHQNFLLSSTWIRWDAGHYIQIAEKGYEYFSCAGHFGYPEGDKSMCGNAGWFIGYPLILRLFSILPFSIYDLAPWVSKFLFLGSLIIFGKLSNSIEFKAKNIVFMLIPAFWFGSIYFNNAFPNSTVLFFILLALYSYLSKKYWLLYVSCILASLSYPTGFLVSIVVSVTMFLSSPADKRFSLSYLAPAVFGFIGLMLFFGFLQYEVNDWSAFLNIQNKYNHGLHNPPVNIIDKFGGFSFDLSQGSNVIILQSATILLLYVVTSFYFFKKKAFLSKVYLLSYVFFTMYLGFPWIVGGDLSIYRSKATLLPTALWYREVNLKIITLLVLVLVCVGALMNQLFFIDVLM